MSHKRRKQQKQKEIQTDLHNLSIPLSLCASSSACAQLCRPLHSSSCSLILFRGIFDTHRSQRCGSQSPRVQFALWTHKVAGRVPRNVNSPAAPWTLPSLLFYLLSFLRFLFHIGWRSYASKTNFFRSPTDLLWCGRQREVCVEQRNGAEEKREVTAASSCVSSPTDRPRSLSGASICGGGRSFPNRKRCGLQ